MKKVIIGLSVAMLALGAFGCSKDKETKTAVAAAPASENVKQIEVKYQLNDTAATDPSTALTCRYVLVQDNAGTLNITKAEVKTSGKCDWNDLKGKAAAAGTLSSAAASQIVSIIAADTTLPASAKDKWDCAALNIKTNVRKVGAQSCQDGKGVADAVAKQIVSALGI